jgi:hypothetical protein
VSPSLSRGPSAMLDLRDQRLHPCQETDFGRAQQRATSSETPRETKRLPLKSKALRHNARARIESMLSVWSFPRPTDTSRCSLEPDWHRLSSTVACLGDHFHLVMFLASDRIRAVMAARIIEHLINWRTMQECLHSLGAVHIAPLDQLMNHARMAALTLQRISLS